MATLDENLFGYLSGVVAISSIVSDRIYPVFAGENSEMPSLVYTRVSSTREPTFDGVRGLARTRVQIDVMADTYTAAISLADAVRIALNGFSTTMGTMEIHYAKLDNEQEFYEEDPELFRIVLDFFITHTEATS